MIDEINIALSKWDPLEVGYPLSLDEYRQYAPKIKLLMNCENELRSGLIEILNFIGLDYDPTNKQQQEDIDQTVKKLFRLVR